MNPNQLEPTILLLRNQFQVILRHAANVYEHELGTGIVLEYYNGLVVQFDLADNRISFAILDEDGISRNFEVFANVSWDNDYQLGHICKILKKYYATYQAKYHLQDLLKLPNIKNF